MKDPGDFGVGADTYRARHLERVDGLIGVEQPELVADQRFVIDDETRAANHIVEEVQRTTPVRVERVTMRRRVRRGRRARQWPERGCTGGRVAHAGGAEVSTEAGT